MSSARCLMQREYGFLPFKSNLYWENQWLRRYVDLIEIITKGGFFWALSLFKNYYINIICNQFILLISVIYIN